MNIIRRTLPWIGVLIACSALSHDDQVGARYVEADGVNATDCLDHDLPCASIQYALEEAQPGNTVKVAQGIYDMSGADPESFLFGPTKAAGGYSADNHFEEQDPETNVTILVGVDARYRQPMARQGFKWAASYADAAAGNTDDSIAAALQSTQAAAMPCTQGLAGQFPCLNVDFQAQIALNQFNTPQTTASNLWGFVDLNDNREYVVIGLRTGTAIVDITTPTSPRQVALVNGNSSSWREVKIYQHHDGTRYRAYAYVTTEASGSGLQVIDLSGLPNSVSLANTLGDTGSQHTLYVSNIDYSTNMALPGRQAFLYVAGANVNGGAWRVYSLINPDEPELLTPAPTGTQYMHDSTSLYITDSRAAQCAAGHNPCEVLVDFNENTVDLWDVTNKNSGQPILLSSTTYPSTRFTHSGWPSEDQRYLFFHDELDEVQLGLNTRIHTMDLANLRAPVITVSYQGATTAIDHNGYAKGNFYYVSHYRRGLVVFDASDPLHLREIGYFDTFLTPAANTAGFDGAWGVYPFFPSGSVAISDISNGLFILKDNTGTLSGSPGQLGFASTTLSVAESAASVTVRLQRTGGLAGAVSVQYTTSNGTATAGSDYSATSGTLTWPDDDNEERTFTIPLTNDTTVEENETIRVILSNPTAGAVIDGATTLDITITDDDATPPASAPAASGGGGGGSTTPAWLLALELLGLLRYRRV